MDTFKIVANILGFIGMGLIFITSALKNKKLVLTIQSFGHLVLGISDAFAGTYSALAQEALCLVRDIGIISKKANNIFKIIILLAIAAVGITVTIVVDNSNVFAFLAVGGNLIFTIDIFYNNKSVIAFKYVSALNSILWMMLFLNYSVYTSAIINGLSALINIVVGTFILIKFRKGKFDRLGNKISNIEKEDLVSENAIKSDEESL